MQDELLLFWTNKKHQKINVCSCGITGILHLKSSSYQSIRICLLAVSLTSENISEEVNSKRIYEVTFNLNLVLTWIWNTQLQKSIQIRKHSDKWFLRTCKLRVRSTHYILNFLNICKMNQVSCPQKMTPLK